MIAVAFPTEFEARDLIHCLVGKQARNFSGVDCYTGDIGKTPVLIIITGIGGRAAADSVARVLTQNQANLLILTGFAGALNKDLLKGQVLVAARYSSNDMLNFLRLLPGYDIGLMCTSGKIAATPEEKAALAAETSCQMVDMEMAPVAEVAKRLDIEILGIRVISDEADETIPADILSHCYNPETGRPAPVRMALHCLVRPHRWGALKKFLAPLPGVRRTLTNFLISVLNEFEEN